METFVPIPGYESLYSISNFGNVKSNARPIRCKNNYTMIRKERELVLCNRNGYNAVTLVKLTGERKQILIHRMVAALFIPNPENKPQVNHKDGNKRNNSVYNLEWCTPSENMQHAFKTGLKKAYSHWRGIKNGGSSRKVKQLTLDGKLVKIWPSLSEITRAMGIDNSGICQVCYGKMKSYHGFKWQHVGGDYRDKKTA